MTMAPIPDGAPELAKHLLDLLNEQLAERVASLRDPAALAAERAAQSAALMALLRARLGLYSEQYLVMVSHLAAGLAPEADQRPATESSGDEG